MGSKLNMKPLNILRYDDDLIEAMTDEELDEYEGKASNYA